MPAICWSVRGSISRPVINNAFFHLRCWFYPVTLTRFIKVVSLAIKSSTHKTVNFGDRFLAGLERKRCTDWYLCHYSSSSSIGVSLLPSTASSSMALPLSCSSAGRSESISVCSSSSSSTFPYA